MGTTITALRTGRLNAYLKRGDADVEPWPSASLDTHLADALRTLWNRGVGYRVTGDVVTGSSPSNELALPTAITTPGGRVSRIDVIDDTGYYIDKLTSWRYKNATTLIVQPLLGANITLRVHGWAPFLPDATDLPTDLEPPVCMLAASLAYGELAGSLVNYKRQQGLDSARVVGYDQAGALSAYWEARAERWLLTSQYKTSYSPRAAIR